MSEKNSDKPCACLQNFADMMRAAVPKNDPLKKIICAGCGKTFWTNSEREYCFDCEEKMKKENVNASERQVPG